MSTTDSTLNGATPGDRSAEKPELVDGRARKLFCFISREVRGKDHHQHHRKIGQNVGGGGEEVGGRDN